MKNQFRVPKKQWNKWNETGRITFNYIYDILMNQFKVVCPPKFGELPIQTRKVVAWNTAWLAADSASGLYQ